MIGGIKMFKTVIIGVDNGYGYTKTSNELMFKSAISKKEPLGYGIKNKFTVDGVDYWVGTGNGTLEIDKTDSEVNKICTLYALANSKGENFNVVVGLPINQHSKEEKEKFRKTVLKWSGYQVKLNGIEKRIFINDVFVFSQGLASLYASGVTNNVIILDVGSRTVDVAYIRFNGDVPTVEKHNTYYCGCMQLYSNIIAKVNIKYQLTLTSNDAQDILFKGLFIDGKKVDTEFISDVCREHFKELFDNLILDYPTKTVPFLLSGGGASLLYNPIKSRFKNVLIIEDSQFSNAYGYKKVGELVWNE